MTATRTATGHLYHGRRPPNAIEVFWWDSVRMVAELWEKAKNVPEGAWPEEQDAVLARIEAAMRAGEAKRHEARQQIEAWRRAWFGWLARGGQPRKETRDA